MRRALLAFLLLALTACGGSPPQAATAARTAAPPAAAQPAPEQHRRDLSIDESMGGHTLARHVGKSDAELADRLRRERQISAASTWTDRDTAERAIGAALDDADGKLNAWERRSGRRPNLVLHYVDRSGAPLGRSLVRGARGSEPSDRALVVLEWNGQRDRFYVLTAYPEAGR